MFRPVSLMLGLRYTRAKRRNHFISFISLSSILGIALGVTVLITVLSVMNGFDGEIKNRIFEMAPQVTIRNFTGSMNNWQEIGKKASQVPGVTGAAPFSSAQAMLSNQDTAYPVGLDGVDPKQEIHVSQISSKMVMGSFNALQPGKFGIVLGKTLAQNLGVAIGDKVTVYTMQTTITPAGIVPTVKRFTVVGIFHAGDGFGFDTQLAYINIQDAQALLQQPNNTVSGIRLQINDLYAAPAISTNIANILNSDYFVTNWTLEYGPLFKAIQLEKTMMFVILLLIVAVAAFNLVASLVMIVNDKRSDIAILRTFGATPRMIMNSFIIQGLIVGCLGTILGLLGGITLALHVTGIVAGIEKLFHVQLLSSILYLDYLPSKLMPSDIIHICIAALFFCLIATIYPARNAAKTQPAEALRYE